jgi:preprotein translocase SecE subunit
MAVAVKNPETMSSRLIDRLQIGILVGVIYVLGSLGVLFKLLPSLWWGVLGLPPTAVAYTALLVVGIAVAGALGYLGLKLVGPSPAPGLRAGIFLAFVSLLVILLMTRWVSLWFEGWVYERRLMGATVGIILTAAIAIALLAVMVRFWFLKPGYEQRLIALEEQGWFSAASYKRNQGARVRRGTILGILILAGAGIWTIVSHNALGKLGSKDWAINVPFTGSVEVRALNDIALVPPEDMARFYGEQKPPFKVDQGTFREKNDLLKREYVKIESRGASENEKILPGRVVSKDLYERERSELAAQDRQVPTFRSPEAAGGTVEYASLTLLPDVQYSLPLLLTALALWVGWRLVNVPVFADFLIATEAELNKVSWTTRRRLIQDTIVVLITVVLLTVFLFVVDVLWGWILGSKPVGVLKFPPQQQRDQAKEQPW